VEDENVSDGSLHELIDDDDKETPKKKKQTSTLCIGLDVGTMHLCCARSDQDKVNITRNVFLPIDKEEISLSQLSDISYVESDDGELFIIGSDAFNFANIFGQKVARPMESGLISPKEIYAIDVLTLMLKDLIGDVKDKDAYCSYSVPAEAIDEGRSVIYHERVFGQILSSLGINHTSVNEAMAIIFSECAKEKFSGIGISFGAGMANCLTGETKIPLLNGEIKTIKELTDNYNGEKFWVYSCKDDGKIVPGLAHSPRKTGTREIVRIHLDNDTYFDCTEDHLIMKRNGDYIKAGELKENDSLMPLYTEVGKWNEMPEYLSYYNNKHRYWETIHSMVAREELGINRKKGFVIHHKNFNKIDNTPENLIQLSKQEHCEFHREISSIGGKAAAKVIKEQRLGKTNEEIYGTERAAEISKSISEGVLKSTSGNTIKEQRLGKTFDEIFEDKSGLIKEKMSLKKKGLKYEEIMNNDIEIEKRRNELSKQCSEQKPWLHRKETVNSGTFKKGCVPWNKGLKGEEYLNHFKEGIKNQHTKPPLNHKVVKVEKLNIHRDVYDLTVDKYHNFAIDNGIFVHNCAIAYKGIEALKFSTARAGDWIDSNAAESCGVVQNRVTSVKEGSLDLNDPLASTEQNKKKKIILQALYHYHDALINYTVKKIIKEFSDHVDVEIEDPIPIVVSGGTSMPKGFINLFKTVLSGYDLPFEVSEIRSAKNPLTAVANGLLVKTMADVRK
jgi:intein/homing endonuclease